MLILAGITIQLVLSDGGIFSQANRAKEQTEKGTFEERLNLANVEAFMKKVEKGGLTSEEYFEILKGHNLISDTAVSEGNIASPTENADGSKTYKITSNDYYIFEAKIYPDGRVETEVIGKDGNIEVKVESIALNKTSLTLGVEENETLIATIKPDDADNKNVTWSSGDTTIATVSSTGEVTGIKAGETTITVTAEDDEKKSASCKVTVGLIPYSWEELGKIAKAISNTTTYNEATTQISVEVEGDTKTLKVGEWTRIGSQRVRILGFNHDTLTTNTAYGEATLTGKAGISFEYWDSLMDRVYMHWGATKPDGWITKNLYTTLNNTTDGKYKDLENAGVPIKQVQKIYNATYNKNDPKTSSDYLWLLSCSEIWGNSAASGFVSAYSMAEEGKQYAFYSNCNPKPVYNSENDNVKHYNSEGSSDIYCWLRSPDSYSGNAYRCVHPSGSCSGLNRDEVAAVAPGFSI